MNSGSCFWGLYWELWICVTSYLKNFIHNLLLCMTISAWSFTTSYFFLPSVVNNKSRKKMISVQNQPLHTVTTISISITFHNGTRANYHDKYTCNVIWQTAHAHCVLLLLVHTYALPVRIIQIQPTPCKLSFFKRGHAK